MSENRNPSYCPAVTVFEKNHPSNQAHNKNKRVIVIGGGCAGLAASWHLKMSNIDVKLFESNSKVGGHANTIHVDGIDIDTGFMVYNAFNYPHLMSFFEELGVEGEDTTMGFSVSTNNGKFEYAAGETLSHLFATRSNLWNPYFYMMIWEIIRFNSEAKKFLHNVTRTHPDHSITAEEFLKKHKFSKFLTNNYLIPMTAAIWSASNKSILTFPAVTLFTFLNNHLLLQITGNLTWKTPKYRSQDYVNKIVTALGKDRVFVNKHVVSVKRELIRCNNKGSENGVVNSINNGDVKYQNGHSNHSANGHHSLTTTTTVNGSNTATSTTANNATNDDYNNSKTASVYDYDSQESVIHPSSKYIIKITDSTGHTDECDEVIFACHPDQALAILGDDADHLERANLGRFRYSQNDTYVHTDESLMPLSKFAWTCWNYISYRDDTSTKDSAATDTRPVYVTYWLNKLQNLKNKKNIFVTLNPENPPASDKILARLDYAHPQYTADSVAAQRDIANSQGYKGTYYCGAWMGYGFHEDGFRSGIEVSSLVTAAVAPWVRRRGYDAMIPASKSVLLSKQQSILHMIVSRVFWPMTFCLERFCQYAVLSFLKSGFRKGHITFVTTATSTSTSNNNSSNGSSNTNGNAANTNTSSSTSNSDAVIANTAATTTDTHSPSHSHRHNNTQQQLMTVKGKEEGCSEEVIIHVKDPWFWVRLAFESDLGMAKSYIAGEWEVVNTGPSYDGLKQLMLVLLDNIPNGKVVHNAGIDFSRFLLSWIGSGMNWLSYRFTMDNSIANSKSNIHAHYDLSNELFELFLDKKHMMYSCGLFTTESVLHACDSGASTGSSSGNSNTNTSGTSDSSTYTSGTSDVGVANGSAVSASDILVTNGALTNHHHMTTTTITGPVVGGGVCSTDSGPLRTSSKSSSLFHHDFSLRMTGSLECAQTRKISALLTRLEPLGPQHTLLDIGFGWGGVCMYAAEKYGCLVHGITLSTEQKIYAEKKVNEKNLQHLITFELIDYREFSKKRVNEVKKGKNRLFDRIVSCEMIEAVGHNHLQSFFSTVDSLLENDGIFVMQAITMPESRYPVYVKSADFLNTIIFPGGCCPSLNALLNAMSTTSTLHLENMINLNLHYAETLKRWRLRFNQQLPKVILLGFDDSFIRLWNLYLCQCEAGFEAQCINLQILTFSRPGNPNMIVKRGAEYLCHGLKLID